MAMPRPTAGRAASSTAVDARGVLSDVLELLDAGISRLAAFSGLVAENMTRGQAWRFLDMGRRLERLLQMSSLLRGTLGTESRTEGSLLEALLEIADSAMTYRRRYLSMLQAAPVLDLLLADETNPRSLAYQLVALAESIDRLPRDPALARPQRRAAARPRRPDRVRLAELDALVRADESGRRPRLDEPARPPRGRPARPLRHHRRQLLQPPADLAAPGSRPRDGRRGETEQGHEQRCSTSRSTQRSMTMSSLSRSATTSSTSRRGAAAGRPGGRATCGSARPPR